MQIQLNIDIKKYEQLVPTDKWLKPIKPLAIDDVNTFGLLILSKYFNKKKCCCQNHM